MKNFKNCTPADFEGVFDRIGKEWMLITAHGKNERGEDTVNTMTASWGGMGFLWNRPVAFCFVRPQRYTYRLTEQAERFSLSFLGEVALLFTACVTFGEGMVNAGKDETGQPMIFHASSVIRLEVRDKTDTPLPDGAPVYKQAQLVFVMESGRVNRRKVTRLTAGQYARVKEALEAERAQLCMFGGMG